MARPEADPRTAGLRLAWVSNALMWSDSARRLTDAAHPGDAQLGFVALYLCVGLAVKLVAGTPTVPMDETARDDCPIDPRELGKVRTRLAGFRSEVLHLHDEPRDHRQVSVTWRADEPRFAMHYVDTRDETRTLTIEEVKDLLGKLDPWLRRHYTRLLAAEGLRTTSTAHK